MKNQQSLQNGFSLVETLVAITILLIVIVGPMSISSSAARSTSFSSEQVVAFFLAQEGAEIAQKARDDRILANFSTPTTGWQQFANSAAAGTYTHCFKTTGCGLQLMTNTSKGELDTVEDCSGVNGCALYYKDSGKRARYTYTSTGNPTKTPYTRVINFEPTSGTNEIKVTSKVTWRTGSQRATQEVVVQTYLFNIYGN